MTTKKAFLVAYEACLMVYPWAKDEAKLKKFLTSCDDTISGRATSWHHVGPSVKAAWNLIGGKGRPSLTALRALKD